MNVLETAKQAEGYILDRRRYYHQHPELSGQEKNTSEQLVRVWKPLASRRFTT